MTGRSLSLLALAACKGVTAAPTPDAEPFDWSIDLTLPDAAILSVWVAPSGNAPALAVGGQAAAGVVLEWDGEIWRAPALPSGTPVLWWVWAEPGGEALAVGEQGTVLRRVAGVWQRDTVLGVEPRYALYGVWADWAVGGSFEPGLARRGVIVQWDGAAWSAVANTAAALLKVWGRDASDVWAVGDAGTIMHHDGVAWSYVPSPVATRLVAVSGRGPAEVYAVGGDATGVVLRWNGRHWSRFADVEWPLSGVWTAPGRPLYVAGFRGYVARFGASGAELEPTRRDEATPVRGVDFHAVAGGDVVLTVGADLLTAGSAAGWRGTLASHGAQPLVGPLVTEPPLPGPDPDAGPSPGDTDPSTGSDPGPASSSDPGPASDAERWPGEGERCGFDPAFGAYCARDLACWLLVTSDVTICTEECLSAADCSSYGAGACCRTPGPQTTRTVCIPARYVECD